MGKALLVLGTVVAFGLQPAAAQSSKRQVRGRIQFEDYDRNGQYTGTRPVRFTKVEILDGTKVLATALTDSKGQFSVWIPSSQLPPGSWRHVRFTSSNYAADVVQAHELESSDKRIWWKYKGQIPGGTAPVVFTVTVRRGSNPQYFNIAETILYGRMYADASRGDKDGITQADVEYPRKEISHYNPIWHHLRFEGPTIYGIGGAANDLGASDFVILHEYGHYLTADISRFPASWGYWVASMLSAFRGHNGDNIKNYDFAWMEGFPTYFAEAVRTTYPDRLTQDYWYGIEPTPNHDDPRTENVTIACLWDVHDGPATPGSWWEPHDLVDGLQQAGGKTLQRLIFEIFDKEIDQGNAVNLEGFHDAWVQRNPYAGSHEALDKILAAHGVNFH